MVGVSRLVPNQDPRLAADGIPVGRVMTIRVPRLSSSDSSHEQPSMAETVYLMLEGWLEVTAMSTAAQA